MGCAHNKNQNGFTLVEISIVMIIIGLLIGGTFGGMKLIENMQVNRTIQDLKAIESAALTFKDTYGRLPGDIVNPASRLPNCTAAPCATSGNGDRSVGATYANWTVDALINSDESFTFWHHLQAADLMNLPINNTLDMSFGEGSPASPLGGGYRLIGRIVGTIFSQKSNGKHPILISDNYNAAYTPSPPQDTESMPCWAGESIDRKIDDGKPLVGRVIQYGQCPTVNSPSAEYSNGSEGIFLFISSF